MSIFQRIENDNAVGGDLSPSPTVVRTITVGEDCSIDLTAEGSVIYPRGLRENLDLEAVARLQVEHPRLSPAWWVSVETCTASAVQWLKERLGNGDRPWQVAERADLRADPFGRIARTALSGSCGTAAVCAVVLADEGFRTAWLAAIAALPL